MLSIQDSVSKAGLPGSYIAVFDAYASKITTLYSNQYGEVDTSWFLYNPIAPAFVGVGSDGYADATFSVDYILSVKYIYLEKLSSTPNPKYSAAKTDAAIQSNQAVNQQYSNKSITGPLLVAAGLVGAALILSRKKNKVGGFSQLPPAAQSAIAIGAVGIIGYLVIFKGGKPSGQALADKSAADLNKLASNGVYPTFSPTQAEGWAGQLRTAFDDCGTDEDTVMNIMYKMQNDADIALLVSTYGTRGYKGCFDGDYFSSHPYNLSEAISSELSSWYIGLINQDFAEKGITFKF